MIMTSRRGSSALLRAVLLIMVCHNANSDLIARPTDAEAVVGGTTFFNCSTTIVSAEIHWFHYVVGDTKDRSFVYGYDQFYSRYLGRFLMEKNAATGSYNLIISSVTIDDAGRYECQDDSGRGDKDSAQLTVLDESPVCQSNIKPQGLIGPNICGFEPDELYMTCGVKYHGNQPPMMQWKEVKSDNIIAEGTTSNASSDRAIYYLKMKVNSRMDGSSYECMTTRSRKSQYGCTSEVVVVRGSNPESVIIVVIVVGVITIVFSVIVGWIVGRVQKRRHVKRKESTNNQLLQNVDKETEQVELDHVPDKEAMENLKTDDKRLTEKVTELEKPDKEAMEDLETVNKRLAEKVTKLEKLLFSPDNTRYRTTSKTVNVIRTNVAEKLNAPVTGITILGKNLFVVSKNYRDIEVYDAETFVFVRIIQTKELTNPLDITSSKEIQCLYVITRENEQAKSAILKVSIAGKSGKYWETEHDNGRLSTYESNVIACFSTKRIIIEYSPESENLMINDPVRLSPSAGFEKLWQAIKLCETTFAVSHSKKSNRQRVCIVDISGGILMTFEELTTFLNSRMDIPICLVWDHHKTLFVADSNNKRVLLLNLNLNFEGVLLETDSIPVRLCLSESRDRVFVGVNCGKKQPETWTDGHISIRSIIK